MRRIAARPAALLLLAVRLSAAAETGDFDGDGRLSIADVIHIQSGLEPASGSMDGFEAYPCFEDWRDWNDFKPELPAILGGLTYLESLRRQVPGSMPNWVALWGDAHAPVAPLPADARIMLSWQGIEPAPGGDSVLLKLLLLNFVPIQAFSIVVESENGVLRLQPLDRPFSPTVDWLMPQDSLQGLHSTGELAVSVAPSPHLITGGRLALGYGLIHDFGFSNQRQPNIEPGTHEIFFQARLPPGTQAGSYRLDILHASELLLADGTLVAPVVEGPGELEVKASGGRDWDDDVPLLDIDPVEKEIHGRLELRVSEAQGFPGDTVTVRIQLLTDVPLNHVHYRLFWTEPKLICTGLFPTISWKNPETDLPYEPRDNWCTPEIPGYYPMHEIGLSLGGSRMKERKGPNEVDRPLEHFRPLGEWIDVADLELKIDESAGGGTQIPLQLALTRGDFLQRVAYYGEDPPEFEPYGMTWPCSNPDVDRPPSLNWTYDGLVLHEGTVKVLGDRSRTPDPPPLDLGVRWEIGDAEGSPGEIVDLPISAAIDVDNGTPPTEIVLAVESDPAEAVVESVRVDTLRLSTGENVVLEARRGETAKILECEDILKPETCAYGIPGSVEFQNFFEMRERFAVIRIQPSNRGLLVRDYPGKTLRRIGSLRVRVPDGFTGDSVAIRLTAIPPNDTGRDLPYESGALFQIDDFPRYSVSRKSRDGTISIRGASKRLRRGDSNTDGSVNLSDAVYTLGYLFLGSATPRCEDAADTNDDGEVNLSDAVGLLRHLFQGDAAPPAPFPRCGVDPTQDALDCAESICVEGA